jgi:formylglycine-generating enzyme
MKHTMLCKYGFWLILVGGLIRNISAETGPILKAEVYAGITLTGMVSNTYLIEATMNPAIPNGWVALTNVVLPSSPWVFIDYASPGITQRFYRTINTNVTPDTNAPPGMVLIPAGSFTMGDTFQEGQSNYLGQSLELPTHQVSITAFYMDWYPVTKALWDEVYQWAIAHDYRFDNQGSYYDRVIHSKGPNHPVHCINWYDAVKWCNARSEKEGRVPAYYTDWTQNHVYLTGQVNLWSACVKWNAGYRLPTEAEWEKAARGGLSGKRFPWGDTITQSQANYYSYWANGRPYYSYDQNATEGYHPSYFSGMEPYTCPVGSFPLGVNGYGLYDMVGNVSEWCWEYYGFYSSSTQNDPRGPDGGGARVLRGANWGADAFTCRVAYRSNDPPDVAIEYIGFRSVLPKDQ